MKKPRKSDQSTRRLSPTKIKTSAVWAVAMFIHVSAIPATISDDRTFFSRLPLIKSPGRVCHAPPTDAVSGDAGHGSKRRLPWFYLGKAGKLFYSINLCTAPASGACHRENKQMFIFCL